MEDFWKIPNQVSQTNGKYKEDMRYLCYTERASGTLNSYIAEELVKEFYDPKAMQEVLEKYVK
jgi:hypothetical protein